MYGRIHYEDAGLFSVVECLTEVDYQRELKAGCRWVEDEPRQYRGMWGEILECQPSVFASMTRDEGRLERSKAEAEHCHRIGVHDYASLVSCLRSNFKQVFGDDEPLTDPQDMIQRMTAELQRLPEDGRRMVDDPNSTADERTSDPKPASEPNSDKKD